MLAAGIVQDRFVGEAVEGKEVKRRLLEATSTATSTGTFTSRLESLPFLSSNLIRKTLNAHMRIRNSHTYIYYWASEASPTLGCSIEISHDIYNVYMYVGMSRMSN